jgi:hypothetical protein
MPGADEPLFVPVVLGVDASFFAEQVMSAKARRRGGNNDTHFALFLNGCAEVHLQAACRIVLCDS